MSTYKIVRYFFNRDIPSKVIEEGLSLPEAKAYCRSPNSSSITCEPIHNEDPGEDWFDG